MGTTRYSADGEFSGTPLTSFAYTGQIWIGALDLYYCKARMYSPKAGRFMQPDPIGVGAGMNLYRYSGSDPLNNVDPSGLRDCAQKIKEQIK